VPLPKEPYQFAFAKR